jgi:Tol biopolymer transport system component
MPDQTDFEAILTRRLGDYVRNAEQPFSPATIAGKAASLGRPRLFGWSPWQLAPRMPLLWLLALLILGLALGSVLAAGLGPKPILPGPAGHQQLTFVRDGDVYVADLNGDAQSRIAVGGGVESGLEYTIPMWAPNGGSVAAIIGNKVEVMTPSGTVSAVFDAQRHAGRPTVFSWAPDSAQIAVVVVDEGARLSLWVLDVATGANTNLSLPPGFQSFWPFAAWSPDGQRIALNGCVCGGGKASALWTVAADGSGYQELASATVGTVWDPVWSPDGRAIAFSRQGGCVTCDETLWVAPIGNGSPTQLIALDGIERGIAWAPDGRLIAVTSIRGVAPGGPVAGSTSALITVRADSSGASRTIVTGAFDAPNDGLSGEWTPGPVRWTGDGRSLIYVSAAGDEYPAFAIRRVAADGGSSKVVVQNADAFDLGGTR